MHNRQSASSHTGAATDGQLLIILLLNTQFSESGTDYSTGAISLLSKKEGFKFKNRRGNSTERKEKTKLESKKLTESC